MNKKQNINSTKSQLNTYINLYLKELTNGENFEYKSKIKELINDLDNLFKKS